MPKELTTVGPEVVVVVVVVLLASGVGVVVGAPLGGLITRSYWGCRLLSAVDLVVSGWSFRVIIVMLDSVAATLVVGLESDLGSDLFCEFDGDEFGQVKHSSLFVDGTKPDWHRQRRP